MIRVHLRTRSLIPAMRPGAMEDLAHATSDLRIGEPQVCEENKATKKAPISGSSSADIS